MQSLFRIHAGILYQINCIRTPRMLFSLALNTLPFKCLKKPAKQVRKPTTTDFISAKMCKISNRHKQTINKRYKKRSPNTCCRRHYGDDNVCPLSNVLCYRWLRFCLCGPGLTISFFFMEHIQGKSRKSTLIITYIHHG